MKVNDLIVELKAEIKELELDVSRLDKENRELKAENERLINELKRMAETVIGANDALIATHAENARVRAELAKATQFTEYVTYEHGDLADLLNSIRSAISDGVENLALDLFGLELLIEEMESQHHEIGFLNQEQKKLNAELAKLKPSWDDAPNNHNWLSMQPDGVWYWWENEPRLSDVGEWWSAEGWFHKARVRQWNKIKEERPKVTP